MDQRDQTNQTKIQVHALHKSGSMFLWPFFKFAATKLGVDFYSVNETPKTEEFAFKPDANRFIVCPIRWFPETIDTNRFYIFVLRSPLDVLISQYYSHGWMHPDPYDVPEKLQEFRARRKKIQDLTIDEYTVTYADELLKRHLPLLNYWDNRENVLVTRYSEMVCDFESWCQKIGTAIGLTTTDITEMYEKFKGQFNVEDELTPRQIKNGEVRHKRKMLPGDHLTKLSPAVISVLNKKFDSILKLMNQVSVSQKTEKALREIVYEAGRKEPEIIPNEPDDGNSADTNGDAKGKESADESEDVNILRFGTDYGEWYVPDIFDSNSVFYCVGAGEDISFDILLQDYYHGEVHIFDPTPRAIKHFELVESAMRNEVPAPTDTRYGGGDAMYWRIIKNSSANFEKLFYHDYGISEISADRRFFYPKNPDHVTCSIENIQGTDTAFSACTKTIKDAMVANGNASIDLLKLSVHGSEGKIIQDMLRNKIYPTVICVQWDAVMKGVITVESMKENFITPLFEAGYQVVYDNGRLKHTFLRIKNLSNVSSSENVSAKDNVTPNENVSDEAVNAADTTSRGTSMDDVD